MAFIKPVILVENNFALSGPGQLVDPTSLGSGTPDISTFLRGDSSWQPVVQSFNTRTGSVVLTSTDIANALAYTPYNASNPANYIDSAGAPVQSFNTRTGAITLTSGDVTTALTFTPYNATNPANYIDSAGAPVQSFNTRTGAITLTSGDVTTALTFTPANVSGQVFTGAISATNLSGTNTGDQTITLTGDVTGTGTGSFTTTLANTAVTPATYTIADITVDSKGRITSASNGTASNITTALGYTPVNKTGDLMSGVLAMGNNDITGLPAIPSGSTAATSKAYVDNLVSSGSSWRSPIVDPDINDVVSTVPGSPVAGATYIAYGGSYPQNWGTGAAAVVSGDVVTRKQDGTAVWIVIKNLAAADRFIIAAEHGTASATLLSAGFFTGDIIQYVSGNPGLTASWTFPDGRGQGGAPEIVQGITVLSFKETSEHYGHSYLYNATTNVWVEISGPGSIGAGAGLAYSGNTMTVNMGAGITQLPSDEVGVDVYVGGGLMTTADGTSSSTVTGAQLSLTKVGTAGTYKSVTSDAYGRITAGTNPTTLAGFGITDAALIASPSFTGVPLAPTAVVNTNTTQLATTAYVVGQAGTASPLMNNSVAVGTSLLYARQDHVHPVDTSRAPLASPVFTGNVTGLGVSTGTSFNSITGLSSTTPLINGTAAVGVGTTTARGDHVHPTDTSRAAVAQTMFIGTTSVAINRGSAALALTGITSIDGNAATATTAATVTTAAQPAITSVGTLTGLTVTGTTNHSGASAAIQLNSSAGTSGQVLTSAGAGATPTWTTPSVGSGTVTSVSVTSANGVSGSVATATTTPAITLTLGAITPTSVTRASAAGDGITSTSTDSYAIKGIASNAAGVFGSSTSTGSGVYGSGTSGFGGYFECNSGVGLFTTSVSAPALKIGTRASAPTNNVTDGSFYCGSNGELYNRAFSTWNRMAVTDIGPGAIGMMSFMLQYVNGAIAPGGTTAGSNLSFPSLDTSTNVLTGSSFATGTWKNISTANSTGLQTFTMFQRIA